DATIPSIRAPGSITSPGGAMKLGLQIPSFSWPDAPASIGPTLARIASCADEVGFDSIWVMDHFFQIRSVGRVDEPMLEGMTALRYMATRLLNSPQSLTRPHIPIMIGGGGEQKTLRLVAQYADATNVFGDGPRLAHKYRVLREHCERIGRPYEEIERTTLNSIWIGDDLRRSETPAEVVDRFGELGDAGAQHIIVSIPGVEDLSRLETIGRDVIPQLRAL